MYLIICSLCRDLYSHEPLKPESSSVYLGLEEATKMYTRYKRDYKDYVESSGAVSRIKIELFSRTIDAFEKVDSWEFSVPVKKLTIVNPDLVEFRKTTNKDTPRRPSLDIAMEIMAQAQPFHLQEEVGHD